MKILQTVTKLDDSKFKPLKGDRQKKVNQLHDNLWALFDIESFKKKNNPSTKEAFIDAIIEVPEQLSVQNFAWTKEVEDAFENHPYHKKFIKQQATDYGWFRLDSYPRTI